MQNQEFQILYEMVKEIKTTIEGLDSKIDKLVVENERQEGRIKALEDRVRERNNFVNIVFGAIITGIVALFVSRLDLFLNQPKLEEGQIVVPGPTYTSNRLQ